MQSPLQWIAVKSRLLSFRLVQFPILQPDTPLPAKKLQERGQHGPLGAKLLALQSLDGTGRTVARGRAVPHLVCLRHRHLFQPGGRAVSVVPFSLEAFLCLFPPPTQTCLTRPNLAALMSSASQPCGSSSSSGRASSSSMTGTALDPLAPQSCSKVRAMVGTVGTAWHSFSCLKTHPRVFLSPSSAYLYHSFHLICTLTGL